MNVHYRKGYFDLRESPKDDKERKVELADAVFSPLEATSIPLMAQLKATADRGKWEVWVAVDRNGINLDFLSFKRTTRASSSTAFRIR